MECEDRLLIRKSRGRFLVLVKSYKIISGINKLNFDDLFEFPSVVQPTLTSHISSMLSQQSVILINIPFLSELCETGLVYDTRVYC